MTHNNKHQDFEINVYRFDPEKDIEPRYQTYSMPYQVGLSVLNVLQFIFENIDPSLSFYYSCRIGKCNGCLMMVNDKATRTCTTPASSKMKIEPLKGYKVIKDLVVEPNRKVDETTN